MEALGGDCNWFDRFAAQHAALLYYWLVTALFMASPENAYNFSLLVEEHAYVTYSVFAAENAELLRRVPPPPIAVQYYVTGNMYNFDMFQTSKKSQEAVRRPPCEHLLDVFQNIRDDEYEHILTMKACQEWWGGRGPSPVPTEPRLASCAADETLNPKP
ncbi:AOX4 [Symbiodinium natans]|uniref:AOX4 protein n=1 Tax=Symbiodinium natans TaxID=878477 RepID=A0A812V3N5_9DINO|nr:AOX4 [Symbiodinium natans]